MKPLTSEWVEKAEGDFAADPNQPLHLPSEMKKSGSED